MKARGSAIIIAMLMITAIGGIAFAIGRLLFLESVSASYYVNGSVAYYAAESGMEEGFLRYRYNMNAELPFSTWQLSAPNQVYRTDLSSNSVATGPSNVGVNKITTAITDPMKQLYDLRMGYIGTNGAPWFGPPDTASNGLDKNDFATVDTSAPYYVKKDEAIKIDLTGFDLSNRLTLFTKFYGDASNPLSTSAQKCNALLEIKFVIENTDGTFSELKSLLNYNPAACVSVSGSATASMSSTKLYAGSNADASITNALYMEANRLQDVIDIQNYAAVPTYQAPPAVPKKVSLYLKPLYYNAEVGLGTSSCISVAGTCVDKANIVSGPSTKIESAGYYGNTTRKLEADIDRQSGTLYDLFDYVIYKGS